MTIIELMTALSASQNVTDAAQVAAESGIIGAKEVYMAWGKSEGHTTKVLEAAWKEAQPTKTSSGARGFTDYYYSWLAEAPRTEQEAYNYVMSNESQNVRNYLTHHLNIWALAESIRQGKKVVRTISAGKASPKASSSAETKAKAKPKEPEWEYNSAAPYESVKAAWETLRREQASKRPAKNKVHPDKVSYLDDAELTAAYTKAFQTYSK